MNPHLSCQPIDPPGPRRRWICTDCGETGAIEALMGPKQKKACKKVHPPCEHCGGTPLCAKDCPGILAILGAPGVHVIGDTRGRPRRRRRT
jgi:hypothetical protein